MPMPFAVASVVSRDDGLMFVAGWERDNIFVIDGRDPGNPGLVTTLVNPDGSDSCGLALEADRAPNGRLWMGGDNGVGGAAVGLYHVELPADPFDPAASWPGMVAVPSVVSGVTPNLFSLGGTDYLFIANRFEQPNVLLDITSDPPTVVGTWTPPSGPGLCNRLADSNVALTSSGQALALVAADFGGAWILELGAGGISQVARFDWTFESPPSGCDRNGDGDLLDCFSAESGRSPDLRRTGRSGDIRYARINGVDYLVTADINFAGHVKVWSLADILTTCGAPGFCPTDCADMGAPWTVVDLVTPVGEYQIDKCVATSQLEVRGDRLYVAYAEDGAHVIDLAVQGLPATGADPAAPVTLTPLASFDQLPGDIDSVLENYPCHPTGFAEDCESSMEVRGEPFECTRDPCTLMAPPASCSPDYDPVTTEYRLGLNKASGGMAAFDIWPHDDCLLLLSDNGAPDVNGAPLKQGAEGGLWFLDFTGITPECGTSDVVLDDVRVFDGCADPEVDDPAFDDGLVDANEPITLVVDFTWLGPPQAQATATFSSPDPNVDFFTRSREQGIPSVGEVHPLTTTQVAANLTPGAHQARAGFAWQPDPLGRLEGQTCPRSPGIPFTVTLENAAGTLGSFSFLVDAFDADCTDALVSAHRDGSPLPLWDGDPVIITGPGTEDYPVPVPDPCGAGHVILQWSPLAVNPAATPMRYNVYRGTLAGPFVYDHAASGALSIGACNMPCSDEWPRDPIDPEIAAPDGRCDARICDSGGSYYYLVSGELICAGEAPLVGREGSLGLGSFDERPLGLGCEP